MKSNPTRLWWIAIALGWAIDLLFWEHDLGVNFAIYLTLCLLGGLYILRAEGIRISRNAYLLLAPTAFFLIVTFTRAEGLTAFLAHTLSLFLLSLFVITCTGGLWTQYGFSDYLSGFFRLGLNALFKPFAYASETRRERVARDDVPRRSPWPIVRGILIALPIVAIFASLLSSADAVFDQRLTDFIEKFNLQDLPEYIWRLFYILFGASILVGVFLHAGTQSSDESIKSDKHLIPAFLGPIESSIVLGSVAALFASFVVIQFQYFFGGQANIHIDGYTFSEYARRGFGELVAVAFFSLLLIFGLGAISQRETETQRKIFSGLSISIVALVLVMLVSAYERLGLYEAAYGFSRLRTYTHVFMIWLALLLVVTVVLEITRRENRFAFAALIVAIGFAASLPLLNVDAWIVRQNIQREIEGGAKTEPDLGRASLDSSYFLQLSDDAIPPIANSFQNPKLPANLREELGAALVCQQEQRKSVDNMDWQSFHLSRWLADKTLAGLTAELKAYTLDDSDGAQVVTTPSGQEFNCYYGFID